MSTCSEFFLDDLLAVTAIPVGNIPAVTLSSPVNVLKPTISRSAFSPSLTGAITVGIRPAAAGVTLVPIRRGTGKAKDSEGDSVAGRLHTVTVSCDVDDRDGTVWDSLLLLERTPRHLLLTFRGYRYDDNRYEPGTQAFVAATDDTYLCNVERDGSKTTVTFRIQCMMGIQLIV